MRTDPEIGSLRIHVVSIKQKRTAVPQARLKVSAALRLVGAATRCFRYASELISPFWEFDHIVVATDFFELASRDDLEQPGGAGNHIARVRIEAHPAIGQEDEVTDEENVVMNVDSETGRVSVDVEGFERTAREV